MKTLKTILAATILLASLTSPTFADDKSYSPPEIFEGSKNNATDGNPYVSNGKPLWRLDEVFPTSISTPNSYKPLSWVGDHWVSLDNTFGGQPAATVTSNLVTLGCRGSWENQPPLSGSKLAALVFIAPTSKTFSVTGSVKVDVWQGQDPLVFNVLNYSKADAKISAVTTLNFAKGGDAQQLSSIIVNMKEGDEIIFVVSPMANYNAANILISGLKIQ